MGISQHYLTWDSSFQVGRLISSAAILLWIHSVRLAHSFGYLWFNEDGECEIWVITACAWFQSFQNLCLLRICLISLKLRRLAEWVVEYEMENWGTFIKYATFHNMKAFEDYRPLKVLAGWIPFVCKMVLLDQIKQVFSIKYHVRKLLTLKISGNQNTQTLSLEFRFICSKT